MNGSDAQVSMWNILPQDVVESILRKLSVRDSWACRGSMSFPSCTVKIPLRPPELKAVSRSLVFQNIDEIAYAVSQLRANGVSIYISMQAADSIDLPAPDVMKSMASVIHEVDYAQPASMTSTSWQPEAYESFSEDHLRALKSAHKQMQVLCISDALTAHQFRREYISLVASFRQLKKLVLQTKTWRLCRADPQSETQACTHQAISHILGKGNLPSLVKGHSFADAGCQCLLPDH
ncbi:hypothetical protein WJX77_009504 [Trebouxia sp. C0004]